ncbi:hypothetical protein R4B61_02045 [Fructilactobacillus vespulae]|uniref:hypothetical protein n=1 Tax=Fructilactobacillus vespulae TaxID=1249630 RepID=UPI0039B57450
MNKKSLKLNKSLNKFYLIWVLWIPFGLMLSFSSFVLLDYVSGKEPIINYKNDDVESYRLAVENNYRYKVDSYPEDYFRASYLKPGEYSKEPSTFVKTLTKKEVKNLAPENKISVTDHHIARGSIAVVIRSTLGKRIGKLVSDKQYEQKKKKMHPILYWLRNHLLNLWVISFFAMIPFSIIVNLCGRNKKI